MNSIASNDALGDRISVEISEIRRFVKSKHVLLLTINVLLINDAPVIAYQLFLLVDKYVKLPIVHMNLYCNGNNARF